MDGDGDHLPSAHLVRYRYAWHNGKPQPNGYKSFHDLDAAEIHRYLHGHTCLLEGRFQELA